MQDLQKTFWEILISCKAHVLSNENTPHAKSHSPVSQPHIAYDFKEKMGEKFRISLQIDSYYVREECIVVVHQYSSCS